MTGQAVARYMSTSIEGNSSLVSVPQRLVIGWQGHARLGLVETRGE